LYILEHPKAGKGSQWTVRELKSIAPDWQGDTLSDGGGLSGDVRVSKAGAVSVRFRYIFRWEGKACWYQCGTWPVVDLAQIRRERDSARQRVAQGVNPALAKKVDKIEKKTAMEATIAKAKHAKVENLTVADLFSAWVDSGIARQDDNAKEKASFNKDVLPVIGAIPLRNLTDKDLLDVLRKAKERLVLVKQGKGGNAAVSLLSVNIRQMLYWAEKRQPWRALLAAGNPADLIDVETLLDPDYQGYRDRVLSVDEIKALHNGLLPLAELVPIRGNVLRRLRFAVWIALSTLCRIGELVAAKWEHIDWEAGTWFIPAANTKGKRGKRQAQMIFLSAFALAQFKALYKEAGGSIYCFPAEKADKRISRGTASSLVTFHQKEGGHYPLLSGGRWSLHDMRRTGATLMQSLGIPIEIIDRCQNHVLAGSRVRRSYLHYNYAKEKAEAWRALGEHLEAIIQGNPA